MVDWFVAGSPLLLLGVPLILFADRNLDHHRKNMREGKEYIWQQNFREEIGDLIFELETDHSLSSEIQDLKEQLEDPSAPNPEGVQSVEDIPRDILLNAPFTPVLREKTENIGTYAERMTRLENHYNNLVSHVRWFGISFVTMYILLAGGQFQYGNSIPEGIYALVGVVGFAGIYHAKLYIDKKNELRKYSDKYESNREL